MRRKLVLIAAVLALLAAGGAVALYLALRKPPVGALDTQLAGVTVVAPTATEPPPPPPPAEPAPPEGPCWPEFGGNPARTLSRPELHLGAPDAHPLWARGMGSYLEYPPSFCDGVLYVNTFAGRTVAVDAATGAVIWSREGGTKASTPAIAGDRVIVSSHDGTVTAYRRSDGWTLWQLRLDAKVESSPVAVGDTAYFGATDGRLFAVAVATGRVRWAYDTGGRINASPSVWGDRICITTYAGSIFCLDRRDGTKLWATYVKRDAFRYESFYASPSTDGERLYTLSRAGKIVALSAETGAILWTQHVNSLGYATPAIAGGRVFVGGFDGALRAFEAETGELLWTRSVGGRVLAPALVVGDLVFFSTLERRTYAVRASDGKLLWQIGLGKYSPGIATDRAYYFSLNGILAAFAGTAP